MRRGSALFIILALVLVLSAGCTALAPQATPVPPTKTPKPTFTHTPDWTPTPLAFLPTIPVDTPTPEFSATPVPTEVPPTETPIPVPQLTARQTVNVRRGPGTNYPAIGRLTSGQSLEITGKNSRGDWLQFDFNGQDGWVFGDLVTISGDSGGIQVAQNIPAPPPQPTPRPQPTSPPPPPAAPPAPPQPTYPFRLLSGVESCEPNAGTTYFEGFVRYQSNAPRNGVCVHIAFYGPRQTKCSGCGGVGDGKWGFSPFGGPAPAGTTVEIFVVSCQGVPEGGQDLATGFGDLTPRSAKFVRTLNQSEQCTGITFIGDG